MIRFIQLTDDYQKYIFKCSVSVIKPPALPGSLPQKAWCSVSISVHPTQVCSVMVRSGFCGGHWIWPALSSRSLCCAQVHCHAGTYLVLLIPVMGNCNATAYKYITYNCVLPIPEDPQMDVMVKNIWPYSIGNYNWIELLYAFGHDLSLSVD